MAGAVQGSPVEADEGVEGRATSWVVGGKREKAGDLHERDGTRQWKGVEGGGTNEGAESWFLATDSRKSL